MKNMTPDLFNPSSDTYSDQSLEGYALLSQKTKEATRDVAEFAQALLRSKKEDFRKKISKIFHREKKEKVAVSKMSVLVGLLTLLLLAELAKTTYRIDDPHALSTLVGNLVTLTSTDAETPMPEVSTRTPDKQLSTPTLTPIPEVSQTPIEIANDEMDGPETLPKRDRFSAMFRVDTARATEGRLFNLLKASERLNGMIIQPGETLSFNTVVDLSNAALHYMDGKTYTSKGTTVYPGGGVCGLAALLATASEKMGVTISTDGGRHLPADHAPGGIYEGLMNVAVFSIGQNDSDLRVTNTTSNPVQIQISLNFDYRDLHLFPINWQSQNNNWDKHVSPDVVGEKAFNVQLTLLPIDAKTVPKDNQAVSTDYLFEYSSGNLPFNDWIRSVEAIRYFQGIDLEDPTIFQILRQFAKETSGHPDAASIDKLRLFLKTVIPQGKDVREDADVAPLIRQEQQRLFNILYGKTGHITDLLN